MGLISKSKHWLLALAIPFTFMGSTNLQAQCDHKLTAKADFAYQSNNFVEAIKLYQKALGRTGKDKQLKLCINMQIARCYMRFNDYKKSEVTLRKVVKEKDIDATFYYQYGMVLKNLRRYEEAQAMFKRFQEKSPSDPRGPIAIASCDMALNWINNPTCYQVENMVRWNSKEMDFSPFISSKKSDELVFTSNRKEFSGKDKEEWGLHGGLSEDLWFVTRTKVKRGQQGDWGTPERLTALSSEFSEGSGAMDNRFSNLYFTRCFGDRKNGTGCRIFVSRRQGAKWAEPTPVEIPGIPDSAVVAHPSISNDGKFIIFSTNIEGGFGGMDLYISELKRGKFTAPKNLGEGINTADDEVFPHLKMDGSLYFSSNRPEGMGGLDIFKAELLNPMSTDKVSGVWGKVTNMRFPINSEGDDFGITFDKGTESGFLSSNRAGGKGSDDIYAFSVKKATITLSGTVFDIDTKEPLPGAKVELKSPDGSTINVTTDKLGFYKKQIDFGIAYDMTASKPTYFNDVNRAETMGLDPLVNCNDTNITRDFYLKTTKINIEFEIQFVFDKPEPLPAYRTDSLKQILLIIEDNPRIVVEIGAHTDSRGSDKYNEGLSQRRTDWIVKWLIDRGVEPERIVSKGYGESEPRTLQKDMVGLTSGRVFKKGTVLTEEFINGLKASEGEKVFEDAHTMNRRVTMKILREDFKSKRKKNEDGEDIEPPVIIEDEED
jgi:peptidoglycan-associated lipoprotein